MTTTSEAKPWKPHAGQQTRFLSSPAYEALFGGAAGPGKTECLVMEALRQIQNPQYRGILFRRTFPSLEQADGLIQRSHQWYPTYGGIYNAGKHYWKFPSGARIYFGHMMYEESKFIYQGAQYQFIGFDELTEFTKTQYLFMITRNRAPESTGLRCYIRSATNPGQEGHEWVKQRFIESRIFNQVGWFLTSPDGDDVRVAPNTPNALSRAFYPARLEDNPSVGNDYKIKLMNDPDKIQRERFLNGDWDAEYRDGVIYENWTDENITELADYREGKGNVYWGADDGYAEGDGIGRENYHPRVVLFAQMNELGGMDIFDEYVRTQEPSYIKTIQELNERPYEAPDIVMIDSSAVMFQGALFQAGYSVLGQTHSVSEGIRNVRWWIQDHNGVRLIRVHPRCTYFIYEITRYVADPRGSLAGSGELRPLKKNDHAMDALRYLMWHLRFEHEDS